jgi:transposase-like protein
MLGELIRAVLERALEAELTAHLGYEKGGRGGQDGNARFVYHAPNADGQRRRPLLPRCERGL